jgi:hypothetical protein
VPLDRAAVVVLLELADSGAMRPGELAARLEVDFLAYDAEQGPSRP